MAATINPNALKACNLCASKEETRYYLNGVLIIAEPRAVTYVATDGNRLLAHREDLPEGAEDNDCLGEWIIPRDAIAKLKVGKHETAIDLVPFADGKLLLGETVFAPVDGTFPDWRRVLPAGLDPEKAPERPQFNLGYLHDFQKAAVLLGYSALSPFLHYGDADHPTAVTFGHEETFGVIMPVRNDAAVWAGAPAWVNPTPLAAAAE